jgi:antitoxin component YwqK of YwqJK toxin-antitoxin module
MLKKITLITTTILVFGATLVLYFQDQILEHNSKKYFENGILQSSDTYKNGELSESSVFRKDGSTISTVIILPNGDYRVTSLSSDSVVESIKVFSNKKLYSNTLFNKSGNVDLIVDYQGEIIVKKTFFSSSENIDLIENFSKNKVVKSTFFREDGSVKQMVEIGLDGKISKVYNYNNNGDLINSSVPTNASDQII